MSLTNEQKIFLDKMDIDHIRIIKLNRDIQNLIEIADDFEHHRNGLLDEAAYIANKLQRCKGVHSVRSRVKDTGHLIEKIIRKWEEKEVSEKYKAISKDNYKSTITDLIGVRAIYLFKSDWEIVHNHILSTWKPEEKVKVYLRYGDAEEIYAHSDCDLEEHNNGYRSIHYIIPATQIGGEKISCEIQTRTIFEEGWSEIDHNVRYPSFSNDPHLQEYLDLFNRMAGNVDQMGSYVGSLVKLIEYKKSMGDLAKKLAEVHDQEISTLESKLDQLLDEKADHIEIKKVRKQLKTQYDVQKKLLIDNNLLVEKTLKEDSKKSEAGSFNLPRTFEEMIANALGLNVEIMKNEEVLKAARAAENLSASINQNEDIKRLARAVSGWNVKVGLMDESYSQAAGGSDRSIKSSVVNEKKFLK
ncbi:MULTISPECIES: hypothetical protein [Acinetobacter]|uniref:hypothetical protein n=1 Tax=Acinetobacter TaxID=469 RepID=UPI00068E1A0C|nr:MULTISPECIES: hypothetical protein [unclassified Acinetobacter]WEE37548.1 hypothetical protein PYV58_11355 [Acinetobacter sp. TAC-1]